VQTDQTLPALWLLSDGRNDASLEQALRGLPYGSALVFRHYHLAPDERYKRFRALRRLARARGIYVILSGTETQARCWGADGIYGAARDMKKTSGEMLRIATAHNMTEIAHANRDRADAIMLSPAFPTRSHPGGATLGPVRFRLMAKHAVCPVIALGGMNAQTASRLNWPRWAAIDGLSA